MLALPALLALLPQVQQPLFLPATEAIFIPARSEEEGQWTYQDLLNDYLKATSQRAVYSKETFLELGAIESTFETEFWIAAERVQETVEALFALEDFVFALPNPENPSRLLQVLSLREPDEKSAGENSAIFASIADLEKLQAHPALFVECAVPTGRIDAESLRVRHNELQLRQMDLSLNELGDSSALLVRGRAPEVAQLAAMIQTANGESTGWFRYLEPADLEISPDRVLALPRLHAGYTVLDLLHDYEERTGVHLQIEDRAREFAGVTPLGGRGTYSIQPIELQEVFEELLQLHGFLTFPVTLGVNRVLAVRSNVVGRVVAIPTGLPNRVSPAETSLWRASPALLLRSTLRLGSMSSEHFPYLLSLRFGSSDYNRLVRVGDSECMDVLATGSVLDKLASAFAVARDQNPDDAEKAASTDGE